MLPFDEFITRFKKQLQQDLPGEEAQYLMAPALRERTLELLQQNSDPRKSGVMALIFPYEDRPHLILTLRNEYEGVHSGQVSFPGGRIEPGDVSIKHTALRETEEEIGIAPDKIEVIGELTHLYIPPSNFLVYPFVGALTTKPEYNLDPKEVVKVIEVSIQELKNDEIIKSKEIQLSDKRIVKTPYFDVQGHVVWGATAMMLSELLEVVRKVERI